MSSFFLYASGASLLCAAKYYFDGYTYKKYKQNVEEADRGQTGLPHFTKLQGKVIYANDMQHKISERILLELYDLAYAETRDDNNKPIYTSLNPSFVIAMPNTHINKSCTVYTKGVIPLFLSAIAKPVENIPVTVDDSVKEKIYGIGELADVTIYGDFTVTDRKVIIKRSPYYLCPYLITDGNSDPVIRYFIGQQLKSYVIGTCFVGVSGLLLYSWARTKSNSTSKSL